MILARESLQGMSTIQMLLKTCMCFVHEKVLLADSCVQGQQVDAVQLPTGKRQHMMFDWLWHQHMLLGQC
jgi:hypothetical protein